MSIKVIGIDLGKSTFHIVGHDSFGHIVLKKKFTRSKLLEFLTQQEICTITFEACGGAHWLGQRCQAIGHTVKLIPPQYVKPYVKGNKNDFIDADAIAEASQRPSMRFVDVKSKETQVLGALHRIREGFVTERTACMSRIQGLLLEFGLSLPTGHSTMKKLFYWLAQQSIQLPSLFIQELHCAHEHYIYLNERVEEQDKKVQRLVAKDCRCQRLKTIPGIGDLISSQLVAEVGNAKQFKNSREMAAWLGLVPRQYSTGGKTTLLGISKRGNKRLRALLVHGARAVMTKMKKGNGPFDKWLHKLRASKPFNVVVVALANKLTRIAWAVLNKNQEFNAKLFA